MVRANTVVVGTGSGTISVTGMTGLNPGDVLAVTPGTYSSARFTNLSGIAIINNGGLVVFTGPVTIGGWKNVSFSGTGQSGLTYGFQFSQVGGKALPFGGGQIYHSGIYNTEFLNGGDVISYSSYDGGTYTGDSATFMFNQFTMQYIHMVNSGHLWYGTWLAPSTGASFVYGLHIHNLLVEGMNSPDYLVWGNSMFGLDFSDWKIYGPSSSSNVGDNGLITGCGNGVFHSIYMNGCYGYLSRWQSIKLNGVGDSRFYNNVKLNTTCYGLVDSRIDAASLSGWTTAADTWIVNNTQINNIDCKGGAYTTATAAIFPHLGGTIYVYNNLSLAYQGSETNCIYGDLTNPAVNGPVNQSNNLQNKSATGIADVTSAALLAGSSAIGAGTTISWRTDDFYHNAATNDAGAIAYGKAPANQPPVANAGSTQTITLPTTTISLDGSASSDPDGTISAYSWVKTSGPAGGTITSAGSAKTTVTGLTQGTYVFTLTVTDNSGATATATVTIVVNAGANIPPVADAGNPQTITLPANSVSLDGSNSTDPDGTIASYSWVKTSGPAAGTITSAASAKTTVTGLVQGTYVFTLTVTDNKGATNSDFVTITVNPAANQPPVANAGTSQSITLPASAVILDGSLSYDPDGTIASYAWTQVSGAAATITNGNAAKPTVSGLAAGTYTFQLTVTDNSGATASAQVKVTVSSAIATPNPVANAGANQTITLPVSSVTLDGSASSDNNGTIASYSWSKTAGPATGSITASGNATTTATGLVQGVYTFQLVITDAGGLTSTDNMTVTVLAAANQAPIANAGTNLIITLPNSVATLDGSKSFDPDGTIVSYKWAQATGPTVVSIAAPTSAMSAITGLQQGQYTFQLTVTDNGGATGTAQVKVTVNAATNQPPVAMANSISITLPATSVTVDGSNSYDPDGTIVGYNWSQLSGPSTASITAAGSAKTTITGLQQGQYTFQLTVTDNQGGTGTRQIIVSVYPAAANEPPVANAGPNQSITLPANSVTLNGTASYDPDGTIAAYSWQKLSGAGAITITNSNMVTPSVVGLQQGTYVFQLTVTDNQGATGTAQVTVIVNAGVAQAPIASAGTDTTIAFPASTAVLDGSGSYENGGSISTYQWQQVSGPSHSSISNGSAVSTQADGLIPGQYVFQLTVTDSKCVSANSTVTVNVVNTLRALSDEMDIFPNPAHDHITVRLISDTTGNVSYRIFDITGRLISIQQVSKQSSTIENQMNVSGLTNGTYFLQALIGTSDRITGKFIKQ